jgi:outer membrane protein OmpA-like peptidoglycan-associated protein
MKKTIFFLLCVVGPFLWFHGGYTADILEVQTPDLDARVRFQELDEGKLLVSVFDAQENPIRGLGAEDFLVQRGIKRARILSVEPLETSKEVPLNIVLVVDNSFSMRQREAVEPLLSALEALFGTIRPIDNIYAVVFSTKEPTRVRDHTLRAKSFQSSDASQLRKFFADAFGTGLTSGTYLYEAMVAGLDIIRRMPERSQKFLVVFSDGEDINSAFRSAVVEASAQGIPNFEAYCVDYMPDAKTDPFLTSFAQTHGGRIWKAKSATELLPIFESFTTTLLYRYVVSYRILDPPRGTLRVNATELNFDALTMIGGAPLMDTVFFETGKSELPEHYVLFRERSQTDFFDETGFSSAIDKYNNVLNLVGQDMRENPSARVRIVGCNSDMGVEEGDLDLSRRRAETVKTYLSTVWAIDPSRMDVEARNLPANPTPTIVVGSRPENQRVEITFDSLELQNEAAQQFVVERANRGELEIAPDIVAEYGLESWELTLHTDDHVIKTLQGTDDLESAYTFSLNELGLETLMASRELEARIRVADVHGDTHEATAGPLPVTVSKTEVIHELVGPPRGWVEMRPETLKIEELTTIDSSPLLNYIFFETGETEIPERYARFANQADTSTFDESKLRGTMEKYHHILNIIGKRLVEHPEARITIVGCNSNRGVEQGRTDLSRSRAEAVRAYLRYIWGIESWRMQVEARNLPAVPSASSVEAGRVENQRVEIHTTSPEILETVKSTYVEEISDTTEFEIFPHIEAGYDLAHWTIRLTGGDKTLGSLEGQGDLLPAYTFGFETIGLRAIGSYGTIRTNLEVRDKKGQTYETRAGSSVRFIKREERRAQKMGYKVLEKYALILFDFDRADIGDRNRVVLNRIIQRIAEVPDARVKIVGHTDSIGQEAYNIDLSERRARTAYDQILAGGLQANEAVTFEGAGPFNPLFDNDLPEGRALNRTVTITLEYEQK